MLKNTPLCTLRLKITTNKEFSRDPECNKKYLKIKIKSYNGKINTSFHDNKYQKEALNTKRCRSILLTT